MAEVISIYEGESYVFKETVLSNGRICLIVKDGTCLEGVNINYLSLQDDVLIFSQKDNPNYIKFLNCNNGVIEHTLDYKKFNYLTDFIEFVVNYILQSSIDLKFIDEKLANELVREFLKLKVDEIDAIYERREDEMRKSIDSMHKRRLEISKHYKS